MRCSMWCGACLWSSECMWLGMMFGMGYGASGVVRWSDMETTSRRVETSYRRLTRHATSYRRLPQTTSTSYRRLNCLHAYTACRKATAARGGQGRVVSGKGQILTTYRGPSSREREGGGGNPPGKGGKPQPNQGGEWANGMTCPPGGSEGSGGNDRRGGGGIRFYPGAPKRAPGVPSNTWRIRG